jgi:hypothetical protein
MKKQSLRMVTRLTLFIALIAAFSAVLAHADDEEYFNGLFACDNNYFSALNDCRASPGYPNDPNESDCRWQAGDAYSNCSSGLPSPSYEMDFCDNARAARDNCVNTYQLDGDYDTFYTCWLASGISQCE